MKANLTSLRIVPLGMSVLMLGACATRTVERQDVVHEQPIIQQAPVQPAAPVVIAPPPAPHEEITAPPSATGYTWVTGQYVWRNGWEWERGHWVTGSIRPMPSPYSEVPTQPPTTSARWVPGYWEFANNDWQWTKGHWESL
jgi:hypothetical protein